jgi:predicted nucleic acid-binding protein
VIEIWDTSALILAAREQDAASALAEALGDDDVAITDAIRLEYLNGARNTREYDRFDAGLQAMRPIETVPHDWHRALAVHRSLAGLGPGHQRSVRIVDLVVAAVAERLAYPVVHVDEDYERIASITGQPTRRLPAAPSS